MNENLLPGKALKQGVCTRLGTRFDTVERLIQSCFDFVCVINSCNRDSSKGSSEEYGAIKFVNEDFLSFNAILTCFIPIRRALTLLERSNLPNDMIVLHALEDINGKLRIIANVFSRGPNFPEIYTQKQPLASSTISAISGNPAYDFWAAICILHPWLHSCSLFQDASCVLI